MADWLNQVFGNFDGAIFSAMHSLAQTAGGFFTPFFKGVSVFGEKGLFFIVAAVVLLLFRKTRRFGACMLFSIAIGALFTNLIIKNLVARPRPYNADNMYKMWWNDVGSPTESEYSFPSGHATVTMASMTALFFSFNKKWSWTGFLFALLMSLSRVYLIVHYTTDVIGGMIIGLLAGTLAYCAIELVYALLGKHDNKFTRFCLGFDIIDLFRKKKNDE